MTSQISVIYSVLLSDSPTFTGSLNCFAYKPFLCIEVQKYFPTNFGGKNYSEKNISCNFTYTFTVDSGNTSNIVPWVGNIFLLHFITHWLEKTLLDIWFILNMLEFNPNGLGWHLCAKWITGVCEFMYGSKFLLFNVQTQLSRASCHFLRRCPPNDQIFILLLSEL